MNRTDTRSNRLNDLCFAVVLSTAAACTGWIAASGAHAEEVSISPAAAAPVQLERVVIIGHRDSAALATAGPVELPRVVITGKRLDSAAIARAGSSNSDV